jgi:hypothetical protein
MYRGTDYAARAYENFEYLAERLLEHRQARGAIGERPLEIRENPGTTI